MAKRSRNILEEVDDCAVVVDKHTGRVTAQFQGFGAAEDARMHIRACQGKVKHMSSVAIVTGEAAKKAAKKGRI